MSELFMSLKNHISWTWKLWRFKVLISNQAPILFSFLKKFRDSNLLSFLSASSKFQFFWRLFVLNCPSWWKVREDDRAICGCHAINTEEVVKEGHWRVPLCVTDNPFTPSFHYCDLHWSPSWEEEKAPVNNATIFQGFQHHLGSRPCPTAWQWWSFGAQTWQHIRYFGFWMNWFSQCLMRMWKSGHDLEMCR